MIKILASIALVSISSLSGAAAGQGNVISLSQKKVSKLLCDSIAIDPINSKNDDDSNFLWSKTFDFDLDNLPKGGEVPCDDGVHTGCYKSGGFSNRSVDKFGNKYSINFFSTPDEKYSANIEFETISGQGGFLNVGLGSHSRDITTDNFSQLAIFGSFKFDAVKYKKVLLTCYFK
jgi:hypothetical protein